MQRLAASLPRWLSGKEFCRCRRCRGRGFHPWVGKIPWRRKWLSTTLCLLGKFHGQRSPVGYSPWGPKQSDTEHACMSLCSQPKNITKCLVEHYVCKEIQPVHSEGDQPWDFFGRNDAEAETPVLWPPHGKS